MNARGRKAKGSRIEREIVAMHQKLGMEAERVPLSGALGGAYSGDVVLPGIGRAEVKARAGAAGWTTIKKWLGKQDMLFLREDGCKPLVVLTWDTYLHVLANSRLLPSPQQGGDDSPVGPDEANQ